MSEAVAAPVDPALSQAPQDLHVLNESPRTIAEEQARNQQIKALDEAPDMDAYKALRKAGKDGTAPASDEPETASEAAARARDEKGRFSAKPQDRVEEPPKVAKPRDDPKARTASIQAEIDKATAERRAAERERDEIRAETARLRAEHSALQAPKDAITETKTAIAEKFQPFEAWNAKNPDGSYEDYLDERSEWRIERRLKAESDKRQQAEATGRIEQLQTAHNERLTAARERYPDWDTKAAAVASVVPNPTLYAAVVTSDRSDDITYYLLSHPQEYAQLAQRTASLPVAAADMVRDFLEAKLSAPAASDSGPAVPMRQSRANPPPKPVGSSPSVTSTDPEDMSVDEYRRSYQARQKAKFDRSR